MGLTQEGLNKSGPKTVEMANKVTLFKLFMQCVFKYMTGLIFHSINLGMGSLGEFLYQFF